MSADGVPKVIEQKVARGHTAFPVVNGKVDEHLTGRA